MEHRSPTIAQAAGGQRGAVAGVELVQLPLDALRALIRGDLPAASRAAGVELTPYLVEHAWLWSIRLEQIERDPSAAEWTARAAVIDGSAVGHVGFHGPPPEDGPELVLELELTGRGSNQ
jgi:hypothetical protein